VKRLLTGLGLVVVLLGGVPTAYAHDAYDDTQADPLRLLAYALHPVGVAVEWLFTRPIHFVVSQPQLEEFFGHEPHEDPFGSYRPYQPDENS
jgi:hypothetical protein